MASNRRIKIGQTYLDENGNDFTPVKYDKGRRVNGGYWGLRKEGTYIDENGVRKKSSILKIKQL